jgi:hypothetical protein
VAVLASLSAGCASTAVAPSASGFLEGYERLTAHPNDDTLLWWERDGFAWSDYRGLIIEPISVYYQADARGREIVPEDLQKLTAVFHDAVVAELGTDYPVVTEPAAGVLRVRCAITDVIPVRPALNVATSLVAFVPVDVGGASIEFEFLDSVTGEPLAAGMDRKVGTRFDGFVAFAPLGQARQAFREWAAELRQAFATDP